MICPKCNKEMQEITTLVVFQDNDNNNIDFVLGRCEACDFDASWERDTQGNEKNIKPFYFG